MFAKVMNWPLIRKLPCACAVPIYVCVCFYTLSLLSSNSNRIYVIEWPIVHKFINQLKFWGQMFAHSTCACDCGRNQITVNVLVFAFNLIIITYLQHSKRLLNVHWIAQYRNFMASLLVINHFAFSFFLVAAAVMLW